MKKLNLLNLNQESIEENKMNKIYGGGCTCGCMYENCGGSSVASNSSANAAGNLHTISGPNNGGPCEK